MNLFLLIHLLICLTFTDIFYFADSNWIDEEIYENAKMMHPAVSRNRSSSAKEILNLFISKNG